MEDEKKVGKNRELISGWVSKWLCLRACINSRFNKLMNVTIYLLTYVRICTYNICVQRILHLWQKVVYILHIFIFIFLLSFQGILIVLFYHFLFFHYRGICLFLFTIFLELKKSDRCARTKSEGAYLRSLYNTY